MRHRALARRRVEALGTVESELVAERAASLGRAGTRLEDAIAAWRAVTDDAAARGDDRAAALAEVTAAAYALLVQRDCIGIRCDNLRWIREHYDLPTEALRRL